MRSIPIPRPTGSGDRPVLDGSFDADGGRLAFNVNDRYWIVDLASGRILALDPPGHRAAVRSVDASQDGDLVASGSDDGTICLWEGRTGRFVATIAEASEPIREVRFSAAGDRLAGCDANGRLRVWKLDRSVPADRPVVVLSLLWSETATTAAFCADRALLAAGHRDGTVSLLGSDDGRIVRILPAGPDDGAVRALAASREGSMLASGGDDGSVRIWDLTSGRLATRCAVGPCRSMPWHIGEEGSWGCPLRPWRYGMRGKESAS